MSRKFLLSSLFGSTLAFAALPLVWAETPALASRTTGAGYNESGLHVYGRELVQSQTQSQPARPSAPTGSQRGQGGLAAPSRTKYQPVYVCSSGTSCGESSGLLGERVIFYTPTQGHKPKPVSGPKAPEIVHIRQIIDELNLRPKDPQIGLDPNGFGVVNVPVNFYAMATGLDKAVNFLGDRIRVRMWPTKYAWGYGDGKSATHTQPGKSWAALGCKPGQRQCSPTAHTYDSRSKNTVNLTVYYSGAIDWGDGKFRQVSGQYALNAQPRQMDVFDWRLSLFADNCRDNPRAIGC